MESNVPAALRVALIGGIAATIGDVLQLVIATESLHGSETLLRNILLAGTLLGVVGIPLYAHGYRARVALTAGNDSRWRVVVSHGGSFFAALGCAVHAATGLFLSLDPTRGRGVDPYQGILQSGPVLLSLWATASLVFLVATFAEWRLCRSWRERAANPLALTLMIVLFAELLPTHLRQIIGPASVNLAHVFFFGFYIWQSSLVRRSGN